ncbi:helix-turn-helix domain-containing protein [Mesoflavibacter zeaxanthinifaciens]|uniref:helix-turn-helix domain-containing protein n=1 Tax=Mesoflavibacter zeaxanthinifaciens TaxID=393060 RepID=UPI000405A189|nr:helix-turn-helix domain-containing protein [Mesoflavibacter zeaxanthinifaciens]
MENPFKVLEEKLSGIEKMISDIRTAKQQKPKDDEDLLTRDQVCKLLDINSTTLWTYTNQGRLQAYSIGSRRYYKKSEIMQALKPVKK